MQLVEVFESRKAQYNQFVASQPTGSFLQAWEWGNWQESLGKKVARYFLEDNNNARGQAILASAQLVRMPLPLGKYYWYAPYGPVFAEGGLRARNQILLELKSKFQDALFIRIEPQVNFLGTGPWNLPIRKSVNIQPAITMVLDIQKTDDQLLASMHPKTRYNLRVAQRHGVEVEDEFAIAPGRGLYSSEAIELIVKTQERQRYRGHPKDYYKKLVDFFMVHNQANDLKIHIYKALYQKHLAASAIMVDFGPTRLYLYGGSSYEYRNVMAPYLLHWRAISDARAEGLKHYDFGGSEVAVGGERGFTRFKSGFGGRIVNYAGAYDFVKNKFWYFGYSGMRGLNRMLK